MAKIDLYTDQYEECGSWTVTTNADGWTHKVLSSVETSPVRAYAIRDVDSIGYEDYIEIVEPR